MFNFSGRPEGRRDGKLTPCCQINGKTPDEAEQKWEAQMQFEQKWKKFSGITSDPSGYENHLGPIAIMKPAAQAGNSVFDNASKQVEDLCQRQITDFASVDNLIEEYKNYRGYYFQDQPGGLYLHVDNELVDYLTEIFQSNCYNSRMRGHRLKSGHSK